MSYSNTQPNKATQNNSGEMLSLCLWHNYTFGVRTANCGLY